MAFVSLGTKTAIALSIVLAASGVATAVELSNQTLARLVEGKETAADMVVDLFAASVTPALDFGDDDSLATEFKKLGANKDIVYAAVFRPKEEAPTVEIGDVKLRPKAPPQFEATRTTHDDIEVTRLLAGPDEKALGNLVVRVSLAPENARFIAARRRIVEFTGLLTLIAGAIVIVIARRIVIVPLRRLSYAAQRLEKGSAEPVPVGANDEIGQLGTAFNAMSSAIVDRERRLAELNRELIRLLDSMRQAILVFGKGGALAAIKSHQAEMIFGTQDIEGLRIQDLLFPGTNGVDRAAFEEWLAVAFSVPPAGWPDVADLAPVEVVLDGATERFLSLDFRPVDTDGRIEKIMLLASDETEKRALQRTVRERDEEHEKQMAAMRRLVAGGGQLLVSVLERARERLSACSELLGAAPDTIDTSFVEQLFAHAHSVKGEARAFDLSLLEAGASALEDYLAILRGRIREGRPPLLREVHADLHARVEAARDAVSGAATMLVEASPIGAAILEQVTVQRGDVERLLKLAGTRPDEIGKLVNRLASRPFGETLLGLAEAVPRWAFREGKRARIEIEGKSVVVPPRLATLLPDVMTHLLRNAVAHGIESPGDRMAASKEETGLIRISATETPRGPAFTIEDDGRGLDEHALRAKGAELGLAETDAARLALERGLSTANVGTLAGHGVGLGAVQSDLASVGYAITLQTGTTGLKVELAPKVRPA